MFEEYLKHNRSLLEEYFKDSGRLVIQTYNMILGKYVLDEKLVLKLDQVSRFINKMVTLTAVCLPP